MVASGVLLGLAAAAAQSASYFFSRLFVVRGRTVLALLVLGHLIMGVMSAALLPALRPGDLPPPATYLWPLAATSLSYLLGQAALFVALRHTEASRASPLLGLKILVLAAVTVLFLHGQLTPLQWTAVVMSVAAALLLNYSGRPVPWPALSAVLIACVLYSLSDLYIIELVKAIRAPSPARPEGLGVFQASLVGVCLSYIACALMVLPLLPLCGRGAVRQWPYAMPFALTWLAAMVFLYACFASIGVIFGNIVQSTRGLVTIVIGAGLARRGQVHLEQRISRGILLRRLAAATLMFAAIVLFFLERLRTS